MSLGWIDKDYVFGAGAICQVAGRLLELIPFRESDRADGTPARECFTLFLDGRFHCRIYADEPFAAQIAAEKLLKVRFPEWFQEAAA